MEYPKGWTCEVIVLQLEYYLAETLSSREALAMAEHVEACPGCAQLLAQDRSAADPRTARGPRG